MAKLTAVALLTILAWLCYEIFSRVWSAFFGGLSKIPGPKLAAATRLVLIRHKYRGDCEAWKLDLHRQYGDVVRVAPDEVSFANGDAWKEIYGFARGSKSPVYRKDPLFYANQGKQVSLVVAGGADHGRQRKNFSHAFSERALRQQEPLVRQYVLQLIGNMKRASKSGQQLDMVKTYNLAAFDTMADLAFGEPLGCLSNSEYVPWISMIFAALRIITIVTELNHYPLIRKGLDMVVPKSLEEKRQQHLKFSSDRVDKRLSSQKPRPDIWGFVLAAKEDEQLTLDEMYANAGLFMVAGTEPIATLLSAVTYQLLRNPDKMKRITKEVREAFPLEKDITIPALLKLKYFNACIEEGLRICPPVPIGLPRVVPPGGSDICGHHVPANTSVYVHHLSTYHNPRNFSRPDEFLPERWSDSDADAGEFTSDHRTCLQPFTVGPRSCLGINLAYLEIRLLLSHVLWHFDLELNPESYGWENQRIFSMWETKPLLVNVKVRAGSNQMS